MSLRPAVVFGHTSGLGLAIAEELLDRGLPVVGVARSSSRVAARLTDEVHADLGRAEDVERVAKYIRAHHAEFASLVYCAGLLVAQPIDDVDYGLLLEMFHVNLFAPMLLESRLFDLIRDNPADIVNVTSSSITQYYPLFAAYAAAKAALAKFTDDLRSGLESTAARVFDVCPSGFASNMYSSMKGTRVPRDESIQMPTSEVARLVIELLTLPRTIEIGRVQINRKVLPATDLGI